MDLLSATVDEYLEGAVARLVGLPCRHSQLREQLEYVEQLRWELQTQVCSLQRQVYDTQLKWVKAKEEASISAQALKRQVAETQGLAEQCKLLSEECSRLESECNLYQNDRELIMEAANEAEERAAAAEDRAADAAKKAEEVFAELEKLKKQKDSSNTIRLQSELASIRSSAMLEVNFSREYVAKLQKCEIDLLSQKNAQNLSELQKVRDEYSAKLACQKEFAVCSMVASAVFSAVCKAVELEKEEALESANRQFELLSQHVRGQEHENHARMMQSQETIQALRAELMALKRNAENSDNKLKQAEIQLQVLHEENQTLNRLQTSKHSALDGSHIIPPLHILGIKPHPQKLKSTYGSTFSLCTQEKSALTTSRPPLTSLQLNVARQS
ncbi:hypothetical protein O6H91_16G047400 [Diphasiastrum complanatum]|uniref:Uncharacterized protein n=2 Tax=Diphasiastrum complanatum TaxID=34168 RepID=A0ACC2BBY5_DIPCM|nr:hypothetical protein O6H91_16G047400 [Diphasiastrum complanatum]KAJ7527298.1 hypothetical protein O6H91_16G047400 [Diphasiastrum complanatum]